MSDQDPDDVYQDGDDQTDDGLQERAGTERRSVAEGRYVFRQGETGDSAFVVLSGDVEIVRHVDGQEEDLVLGIVPTGGMFGEMALINDKPRMASARAVGGSVDLIIISRDTLRRKLENADPFQRALLDILTNHVRAMADKMVEQGLRIS